MIPKISNEFFDFCSGLHQGYDVLYGPEPQDWVKGALEFVRKDRRRALRDYVDGLLKGGYNYAELQSLWKSTYADLGLHDETSMRNFLRLIGDTIDGKTINERNFEEHGYVRRRVL